MIRRPLPGAFAPREQPTRSPWLVASLLLFTLLVLDFAFPFLPHSSGRRELSHASGGAPMSSGVVQQLRAQLEALSLRIETTEKEAAERAEAASQKMAGIADELASAQRMAAEAKGELERLKLQSTAARAGAERPAAPVASKPKQQPAVPAPKTAAGSLVDLSTTEKRHFSQNGEDGVIEAIFGAIGTGSKYYVEFGTETGVETNTRRLREQQGWTGLLLDGGNENAAINLHRHFLDAENIVGLFQKYDVPQQLDLLSVDVDRNDWYILRSLVAPKMAGNLATAPYRPRVVIVEYNSDWPPPQDKVVAYDASARWDGTNYFGASLSAFAELGRYSGYTLVYADRLGVNLFFVADEEEPVKLFAHAGDEAALWRPPGYADCQLYHRAGGHCEDEKIGQNRSYLAAADLLA